MRQYAPETLYPKTKRLSGTQILDYAKSPSDFYIKWIAGFGIKRGVALEVGVAFGELYADRSFDYVTYLKDRKTPARLIQLVVDVMRYFPPAQNPEYEMIVPHRGWEVRVTLDDFYPDQATIVEHKTSALMWTQEVVDNHTQVTMQQWAYWKLHGKVLKKHYLHWVDTGTHPRKAVETFISKRSVAQLKEFEREVLDRVIDGLEAENFINNIYK